MQVITQILDALLACIDWLAALNRFQLTTLSVSGLAAWLLLANGAMILLAGGYPGDRTKEDDETEDAP